MARPTGRKLRDEIDDDEDDNDARGRGSSQEVTAALAQLRNSDEEKGINRLEGREGDKRVVIQWKENIAPYRAGEVCAVRKAYGIAACQQDFAILLSEEVMPRDKSRDWINAQPRHNVSGGVAANAAVEGGRTTSKDLAALAQSMASAAQVAGLKEKSDELEAAVGERDAKIKSLEERLLALEAKAKK